jgi:hypothetical protein
MCDSFDKCESAMIGHAIANNFQASTHMAIEIILMHRILCKLKLIYNQKELN